MKLLVIARTILSMSMVVWIGCIAAPMIASLLGDKDGVVFWGVIPVASVAIGGLVVGAVLHLTAQAITLVRQHRDGRSHG